MMDEIKKVVPNAKLVYNNSPSFNWTLNFRQQVFDSMEEAGKDLLSEKVPSENFVTVEQLGGLCSFLCSDNAEQLTGQDIAVDGGWTSV